MIQELEFDNLGLHVGNKGKRAVLDFSDFVVW